MSKQFFLYCLLGVPVLIFCQGVSWSETPLYEEEPYDQITLDAANNHAVLKVKPLEPQYRRYAAKPRTDGKLIVYLLEEPDKPYELAWRAVVKVELFEQLVLNKAGELVGEGRFDEAFDYFNFLLRQKPNTPGLATAYEDFLYEEAKQAHREKKYDSALALLQELHQRNPNRQGLEQALGKVTDNLVEQAAAAGDYATVRAYLRGLAAAYPQHEVVARWNEQMQAKVAPMMSAAQAAAEAGRWSEAAEWCRKIAAIWPDMPGARELARKVHQKHARVVVGVVGFAGEFNPASMVDWNARRAGRLLYRTLAEFAGPGTEGGNYIFPVGEIALTSLGQKMTIRVKSNICWAENDAALQAGDVARLLLDMADPAEKFYRDDWAKLLKGVSIRGNGEVEVELRRPHVRPEAFLQVPLLPYISAPRTDRPPPNGPFVLRSQMPQEMVFEANRRYFALQTGQPMEVVERRFDSVPEAVAALKRGEIDIVERLNPWQLEKLRNQPKIVIQPYGLPLIHCLIPNVRRPLLSDRTFRRALLYGINRQAILRQMLGGEELPGCVVTSSPFPLGLGPNDPLGYATDENIQPRPYEPRLAVALANVSLKNYLDAQHIPVEDWRKAMPKLVLAHPPDEIARGASASIQKQLEFLGIPITLRQLEGPLPERVPEDVDLLYVELAVREPVVDADRLLGEQGLTGGCSPYMRQALRQLDLAIEWAEVREHLRRIHRLAYEEVVLLPLWQLLDQFAYRENLRGIPERPVALYQNIEQWRPPFQYPAEK